MKYKITIVVEGKKQLKNNIKHGHVEKEIKEDIFPDEEILSFEIQELSGD